MSENSPQNENAPVFTPKSEPDGASILATEHVSAMSEPSEHAIAAEQEDAEKYENLVDKSGTPFDPEKHATDADGNPVKTQAGNWRKRPGRKAGQGPASSLNTEGRKKSSTGEGSTDVDDGPRQSAEATVDTIGTLAQTFGGEDYAFRQMVNEQKEIVFDERLNGVRAFERLYREKGVKDIPPGVAVTLWAMMFIGSRVNQDQKAKSKIKLWWYWLVSKVTKKPAPKQEDKRETEGGR